MRSEFVEELKITIEEMINNIHTILPGKILSYDSKRGFAKVQPQGKFKTPDDQYLDYPIISEVPIVLIEDPDTDISVSRPIVPGQGCILFFAEKALDDWYYGRLTAGEIKFDLTNAIVIPGLFNRPSKNTAEAISKDAVIVRNKNSSVTVQSTTITVDSAGNVNINAAGSLNIDAGGNINVTSGGQINFSGSKYNFD